MARKSLAQDPLYRNSLREARLILIIWFLCGIITVTICYLFGYLSHEPDLNSTGPDLVNIFGSFEKFDRTPESLTTPLGLGIPDWIFYGIVIPWLVCIGFTFWFCLSYFSEDELDDDETLLKGKDS